MKRLFLTTLLVLTVFFGVSSVVLAQGDQSYGLNATAEASGLKKYGSDLPAIIGNVIGAGLSLISVLFFILMVYGGIRWMFARGNDDQAKKALDTIIAAVIGMIIVLASYAITNFVFNTLPSEGADNTQVQASPGSCVLDSEIATVCASFTTQEACNNDGVVCAFSEGACKPKAVVNGVVCGEKQTRSACDGLVDVGCVWKA